MSGPFPWDECTVADGDFLRRDFGTLVLLITSVHQEWRLAAYPQNPPPDIAAIPTSGRAADLPEDIVWERWDRCPDDSLIRFRPAFPALPVIARPRSLMHISPGGAASFFVGIPACVEILAQRHGQPSPLKSIPTQTLSKTWHGTALAGNLGYALKTYARRTFEPQQWPAHDIVCAIDIVNDGSASLPFERLYLETQHLSVFSQHGCLWSNAARLRVNVQENNLSNITYASRPAPPFEDATEITPPVDGRRRRSTIHSAFARVLEHFNPLGDPS